MSNKTLLGQSDSFELEPFEYPWAWDMSKECEANTWTPEEISVAGDVMDYRSEDLDPLHKHVFEGVLAQLTTFDILRGDDAAETFLQIFQAAEIKHFLKRLVWEEGLHTRSYRYIIENLGIDLEIYKRWETVPIMKKRVDLSAEISRPVQIIVANQTLDPNYELKQKDYDDIFISLVWWFLIFEGVWFWMNLYGPLNALARLKRFRGAAEQFGYILRDETQHVRFGLKLIHQFQKEYGHLISEQAKDNLVEYIKISVELEKEFAFYFLDGKAILGYSIPDHVETTKYFANLRLKSIGMPPIYKDAEHKFPWFSEATELKKEINFFEKRVTEYQVGGTLKFDDNIDDQFSSVM